MATTATKYQLPVFDGQGRMIWKHGDPRPRPVTSSDGYTVHRPPTQAATLTENRSIPANKVDSVQVDTRLLKGQETRERLRKNVQVFPAASVRERARMLGVSKSLVEKYLLEIQHRQQ